MKGRNRIQRQRETFAYRFAYDLMHDSAFKKLNREYHAWYREHGNPRLEVGNNGPLSNWRNIEDFLKANYPESHRGLNAGMESAGSLLDGKPTGLGAVPDLPPYETGPEAEARYGYDPREVTATMLLLHNLTQGGRDDFHDMDVDRLADIARKRSEMQRNYEQRQANSYRHANDLVKEYTDQLYDEFHDWGKENGFPVHYDEWDYTKPMGGPLTYWDNIEGFLKDRYPAAHRDYRYGEENAADALDGKALRMPSRYSPWPNRTYHPPYETGPEAIEKYGYDPRQVAAGFMYLHTWSHAQSPQNSWRGDKLPRDINRLAEIFQKRQQMQRNYENRTAAVVSEEDWRVPDGEEQLGQDFGPAAQSLTNRLQGEFDQWALDNGITEHPFERGVWEPDNPRGPIGHWPYIENFLEDNYPAAHRGLQYGMETAQPLMDGYSKLYNKSVEDRWVDLNGGPYQTGPDAVIRHGYDPKEIAAAFLYLHNRSHAFRNTDEWIDQDVDRLFDIFKKRQQMQRNYEQRQANSRIAMPTWYHLTDDPDFRLNPRRKPKNFNNIGRLPGSSGDLGRGVFLTQNPDRWVNMPPAGRSKWSGDRPYIADIDAPDNLQDLPGVWHDHNPDHEIFVPADQFHHLKVKRVRHANYEQRQANSIYRFAMPVPTQVPKTRNQWLEERDRLRKKFDKAGVPNDIVPNFDDDWGNQVYDQNWDWEGLRGGRSSWYADPLEYEGKGQPGIAQRHKVTREGIPINYLIHHDDDGQINGILSHFPEGSPHEKPGAITVTVHPEQRGRGIGRTLAEESEKRFGVDLDSQQYTPLGYEMYRKIKNDRGQQMPDIFNKPARQANSRIAAPAEDAYDSGPPEDEQYYGENVTGKWYHVSPHKLPVGTKLTPQTSSPSFGGNERPGLPPGRERWVWMDSDEGIQDWFYALGRELNSNPREPHKPIYLYEVAPSEGPHPWNGTGWQGHVAPSATIKAEVPVHNWTHGGEPMILWPEDHEWHISPEELAHLDSIVPFRDEE